MVLVFPFLFPRPMHSRASSFAWLSRDFSRLPRNGELARTLYFTRDRFSPHKRGLEYRFKNTTPEKFPNNGKLNEMEYAEQGCQFKTVRAHFLCDVFPSVAVAGWNGSHRVGPGQAFSVDPVSSIITLDYEQRVWMGGSICRLSVKIQLLCR